MTSAIPPEPPSHAISRVDNSYGPRSEDERRLFDLVQEGLNSGPPIETTLEELMSELRNSIRK